MQEEIARLISEGNIDTVALCFPDMAGRLMGKREGAKYFTGTAGEGSHMCDYLLTVDVEGNPIPGFQSASWEKGYGDFLVKPDMGTWRKMPWISGQAIVIGDCVSPGGELVPAAPRTMLKSQIAKASRLGFGFNFASELEFYLYEDSFDTCIAKKFEGLTPSSPYSQDYNLLRTTAAEPLFAELRAALEAMNIEVETTKGEWGPGQQEISLRYSDPLTNADNHVYYKQAVKEIAAKHGKAVTFMAKPASDVAGSSCHIHASLWSADGSESRSADPSSPDGLTPEFRHFMAGVMAHAADITLFLAPTINSYKRFQSGSFAPTRICWGRDNRTTGFRLVGHGKATRMEVRIPGADANVHTAFAAIMAAGLHGIAKELPFPDETQGNAYSDPSLQEVPKSLSEAITKANRSTMLREAFGDSVVDHYVHAARWEVSQYEAFVTDWEKRRLFERI